MEGKTIEISMEEFIRLYRVDTRMDTLISYIKKEEKKDGYITLDTVKLLIGMVGNESL